MDRVGGPPNGLTTFQQGLATGGRQTRNTVSTPGQQTPFSPPAAKGGPPPGMMARLPEGTNMAMFRPGNTLHGKVTGFQNGQFTLRLGDQTLQAQSRLPMQVGDSIQVQVQGENQGQLLLKLMDTPATKMTMADLSNTLSAMKLPVDGSSMELAKNMVELRIPLTKDNFAVMKQALAQTNQPGAAPVPTRVAAVGFLQNAQLPVTPQNVTVLSNFLHNNPQLGMQMMELNTELKKLTENTHISASDLNKMIGRMQKDMGKMMMEPPNRANQQAGAKNAKNLKDMAKQAGIEFNLGAMGYGGGEEWDYAAILQRMRERFAKEGVGDENLHSLMKGLQENLEAQKLINSARTESNLGYYYLQLPMAPDPAEVWLEYNEEGDGRRMVDSQDCRVEFMVNTDEMGELHFLVEIRQGKASVYLGTASEEVRRFAMAYLPALAERVTALGWERGMYRTVFRPHGGKRQLVEHTDFEDLERYNVQA